MIRVLLESGGLMAGREPAEARELWAAADWPAGTVERTEDWGAAPDTTGFMGRADELALLRQRVLGERCRLVALLGMGGIGKTSLAAAQ